jgi:hypothetical protein
MASFRARALAAAALLALAGLPLGCGSNRPGTLLAPTGPRPVPANPTGSVFGTVDWDPAIYPDLAAPPYPPTIARLKTPLGVLVAEDTLDTNSNRFEFPGVPPGDYVVGAGSRAFRVVERPGIRVAEGPRDAGHLTLPVNGDSLSVEIWIVGRMPGFSYDEYFTNSMSGIVPGLWTYPSDLYPATPVPAGTFRFKFVTDPSFPNDLIGWGGDSTQTLVAPVSNAKVRFGRGPAHDLKVTFPTAGVYNFLLDERRQTFSVQPAPPPTGRTARRTR